MSPSSAGILPYYTEGGRIPESASFLSRPPLASSIFRTIRPAIWGGIWCGELLRSGVGERVDLKKTLGHCSVSLGFSSIVNTMSDPLQSPFQVFKILLPSSTVCSCMFFYVDILSNFEIIVD